MMTTSGPFDRIQRGGGKAVFNTSGNLQITGLVGIGMVPASYALSVYSSTAETQMQLIGDGRNGGVLLYSYGTNKFAFLSGRSARGSLATPSKTLADDVLMRFGGAGYYDNGAGSAGFAGANRASVDFKAKADWDSSTDNGTYITFSTTADGSSTLTEQMRIDSDGRPYFKGPTQSTVGAAGAASNVPASPDGYLRIYIGTTAKVVPYFAES